MADGPHNMAPDSGTSVDRHPADYSRTDIQFRNIFDTAMDGILAIDERQRIVLFNAAAEAIFGYRAGDVLGKSLDELIPERFRPSHRELVEQFGRGDIQSRRMGTQRTVSALRASGEEFPIEASISQTADHGEKIYTVILRDVTEAVRHRRQIERQSQMLDQVSDAVSVLDLEGRISYWNRGACRLFGWSVEEALGKDSNELLYRSDPETWRLVEQEAAADHSWTEEIPGVTRSGKPILVEHRRTALRDEAGRVQGFLCIDIDITDRRKRERTERRSQRLESIGTLAGGIAHDLNNVLTPILMGAKLLASGRTVANRQGLLETMLASAERGAALVHQLLAFAGGVRGERSLVEIARLMAETRGLLEHTFPKSIAIVTNVEPNLPGVLGDATELSQVLMNLCINARDAMPEGGTLTVEATDIRLNGTASQLHPEAHPGAYVVLKVADTGQGMTSDVLERIFDPFFTTKEFGKGTGLGLATVQGIVKSHGGFITVYSEPGQGSTFSIFLPAVETAETTAAAGSTPSHETGRGHTVLIVDDEDFILQTTAAALESCGYRVLTARDGVAATVVFTKHWQEISVVLLDMMMPELDGLQTMRQLRRIDPRVVVVACSGLRTAQREAEVLQQGAAAFLPKPYSEEHLLQTLSALLTRDV
jgi:two-component system cell cycle sensor histidine kinase/response regulator CckA